MADYSGDANRNFLNLGRIDKGIAGADVSSGVGRGPDRLQGLVGAKPMATGNTTLTAKASDNSQPGLNATLNAANAAARRTGTTYMPKRTGR